MLTSRHYWAAALAGAIFVLSACGGGGGGGGSIVGGALAPTPSPQGATIPLSSTGTPQALPNVAGITSSIALPANSASSGATLKIALSTSQPSNMVALPAKSPQAFLYFTLQASSNATFNGLPKFAMTLPSAPRSQGAFYAWMYNTGTKTWTDFGPVNVSGSQVSFGGTSKAFTLSAGVQYVAVPFTAAPAASCPTPPPTPPPTPTPSPTPTPVPVTGSFYVAANTFDANGNYLSASVLTYDEATGHQKGTLNLGYGTGTLPFSSTLSSNGALLYVTGDTASSVTNSFTSNIPIPGLTIINTASNTIVHQTTIAGNVFGGTLSADQTRFYGVGYDSVPGSFVVFVFDASSGSLLHELPLPASAQLPKDIVVNNAGTTAYVMDQNAIAVYKVDLATGAASVLYQETQRVHEPILNVALDPTDTNLYLGEFDRVLVFNAASGSLTNALPAPTGAPQFYNMAESGDRKTVLLAGGTTATVLSTASGAYVNTFATGTQILDIDALNGTGTFAALWQLSFDAVPVSAFAIPSGAPFYNVPIASNLIIYSAAAQ